MSFNNYTMQLMSIKNTKSKTVWKHPNIICNRPKAVLMVTPESWSPTHTPSWLMRKNRYFTWNLISIIKLFKKISRKTWLGPELYATLPNRHPSYEPMLWNYPIHCWSSSPRKARFSIPQYYLQIRLRMHTLWTSLVGYNLSGLFKHSRSQRHLAYKWNRIGAGDEGTFQDWQQKG